MNRTTDHEYVGDEFTIDFPLANARGWTHGVCVSVTLSGNDRIRGIRLRFPDHTERSFAPSALKRVIPYRQGVPVR